MTFAFTPPSPSLSESCWEGGDDANQSAAWLTDVIASKWFHTSAQRRPPRRRRCSFALHPHRPASAAGFGNETQFAPNKFSVKWPAAVCLSTVYGPTGSAASSARSLTITATVASVPYRSRGCSYRCPNACRSQINRGRRPHGLWPMTAATAWRHTFGTKILTLGRPYLTTRTVCEAGISIAGLQRCKCLLLDLVLSIIIVTERKLQYWVTRWKMPNPKDAKRN